VGGIAAALVVGPPDPSGIARESLREKAAAKDPA
jgi:hypothetical protein